MSKVKKIGKALATTGKSVEYAVTLGGSKAVNDARKIYDASYAAYKDKHDQVSRIKSDTDDVLKYIGDSIASVQPSLVFCQTILGQSDPGINHSGSASETLEKLHSFKTSYNSALNAGFGGAVGGATAVGAWAVVSMVGSASTGAALSGLSGVAAYNATLAWFGGGALAAGGAGMSGGMMVLGGIVAAPIIFLSATSSYKKAKKIMLENEKVLKEANTLLKLLPEAEIQLSSLRKYYSVIKNLISEYIEHVERLKNIIYPRGKLSRAKQTILRIFGMKPYTDEQIQTLGELQQLTDAFLVNFDKHSFNSNAA